MSAVAASARVANDLPRLGRRVGLLYLALVVLGMIGPLTLETLVIGGDAAATAAEIEASRWMYQIGLVAWVVIVGVDLVVSLALYRLFVAGGHGLAAASSALRLTYTVGLAALIPQLFSAHRLIFAEGSTAADRGEALRHLEAFGDGFLVVLVFFGIHLVLLGVLVSRTRRLPAVFGPLLAAAGAAYVVDCFAHYCVASYGGLAAALVITPAVVGEVGLTGWLLARGVRDDADQQSDEGAIVSGW